MVKRIVSAVIGISFILLVIALGTTFPILIDISMAIVCAFAVGEFIHAIGLFNEYRLSIPSVLFAICNAMLFSQGYVHIVWYAYTAIMLSIMIFFHEKISFRDVSNAYGMTIIISYGLSSVISMKNLDIDHSLFYFILALALPWLADAGAYFAGSFFGKHKLCPKISPKKTVEGVIGGTIVCVGMCCLVGYIFSEFIYKDIQSVNYINLIVLSFVGSLLSVLGDLSFSLVKRAYKIKDYGTIIPGHGGVLDRFDSVIFVSPFLLITLSYLPVLM